MNDVIASPLWLQAFQKKQFEKFLQRGVPTRKEENWKYTDLSQIDYRRSDENADLPIDFRFGGNDDKAFIFMPLFQAVHVHEKILKPYLANEYDVQRFPFAVLNSAQMQDGVFLYVPKNVKIAAPIHLLFRNNHLRNIIIVEEGAELTLIEEYSGNTDSALTNVLTELHVAKNARVRFYKIQNESITKTHIANIFIQQQQDSYVELFTLSKGAKISREDVHVKLLARGAECHLSGFYSLTHDEQHVDHHLQVDHVAEHGTSSMLYKGILDKKSRAVFNGKVHVHPHAQHTHSYQANHNVLLSKDAEVNTKPELEIYADDVKCTHGATVGQIDAESLFYLRSRGIEKQDALKLLLTAFADDVLNKITDAAVREMIQKQMNI